MVLLLIDRGFSLSEIGLAAAAQGLAVLLLELPTGGLADTLGRRPVILLATAIEIIALIGLLLVHSLPALIVVFLLFGVFRALESGPLDAWYVDAAQRQDPNVDITGALAASGTVIGLAIATGALLSGGLVALDPIASIDPLLVPLGLAVVLRGLDLGLLAALMVEERQRSDLTAVRASVREMPIVIGAAFALVRQSPALMGLIAVEFFWGFGMTAFEGLIPPKVAEAAGDAESAAALLGPANTGAWIAAAIGASLVPRLARRLGTAPAAMALHLCQAVAVIGMAIAAGPAGVILLYMVTLGAHGAINPLYQALLHEQAEASNRATVLSAASMAGHPGGAIGGIALGRLADQLSVSTAMVIGALVLLVTLPLYIPALRSSRAKPGAEKPEQESSDE